MSQGTGATNEETFALIAEQISDVLVRVDRAGLVTYISPAIRAYGWEPEELIGTTGFDLVHPEDRPHFVANVGALLEGKVDPLVGREHRILRKDGGSYWAQGNPRVLTDETGAVCGIVNIFRDVTVRREMEARAREQAELFEE